MFNKAKLSFTILFSSVLLFTTVAISLDRSNEKVITGDELKQMSELRTKIIESKSIDSNNSLKKVPQILEMTTLKPFKQSLLHKKKLMVDVNNNNNIRAIRSESNGNISRDCSDCEFDFTNYGSECCDSAWDEYGIDCATLESNYSWDCSGCACPGDVPCEDQGLITCEYGAADGGNCAEDESGCLEAGDCPAGQVADCDGSGECWPESWIGDGFADCEDQAYGADLTCYDNDGGDCDGGGGTSGGGTEECSDCAYDFTPYGSECCDTAWYEYGIDCSTLENNYYWDCSGCECPGDNGGTTGGGDTGGGECPDGYVQDCVDDDCCPESWIGDGFEDCEDQAYGCDLTCYDCDGGDCGTDCGDGTTGGDTGGGDDTASVQVIHNSPSPTVDVYLNGALAVEDFEYRTATPVLELPLSFTVGIAPANGDVIAEFPFELMAGGEYVVVATGILGDENTPFTLAAAGTEFGASNGNVGLDVYHGSTDAPAVDVYANGGLLLSGLAYGDFSGYTQVPAADYVVGIAPEGGDVIAEFEAPLAGLGGGSAVVFASGFLSGDDPAFGLFAALGDGTVLALPVYVAPEPEVVITAEHAIASDGMAHVSLSYHSSVEVAGVQFTLSDDPESAVATEYSTDNGDFTASFNDTDGDVTTVYFSLTGSTLPATDEATVFATLSYELTSELGDDDVIALHFTDVVCASPSGTSLISEGVDGSISTGSSNMAGDVNGDGSVNVQDIILIVNMILDGGYDGTADVNGDGSVNVQDIILIVNMILDGRVIDATRAEILTTPNSLVLKSDGFIGAIQMTLQHESNFSIDVTDEAMVADYRTKGNNTTVVIVVPENEELFTYNGSFEIIDIMVVNSVDEISVVTPAVFSLGTAYPNPFNPTTNIDLDIASAGYVNVSVYNLMGQVVSTLVDGHMSEGVSTFRWDASDQVSGMYLVRAETSGAVSTQKLMLIK